MLSGCGSRSKTASQARAVSGECVATQVDVIPLNSAVLDAVSSFLSPIEYAVASFALGNTGPLFAWTENFERDYSIGRQLEEDFHR